MDHSQGYLTMTYLCPPQIDQDRPQIVGADLGKVI